MDSLNRLVGDGRYTVSKVATIGTSPFLTLSLTIELMRSHAFECSQSGIILTAVQQALALAGGSVRSQVLAIYDWVKDRVSFIEDEQALDAVGIDPDKELLIKPDRLLAMSEPKGDCDDYSMLLACMLIAAKLPIGISYVTIAADSTNPERYSHVYVSVQLPDTSYLALDASHGPYAGWEETKIFSKIHWNIKRLDANEVREYEVRRMQDVNRKSGVGWTVPPRRSFSQASQELGQLAGMHGIGAIDWGNIINMGVNSASKILSARYGVPPEGTSVYTRDANGNITQTVRNPLSASFGTFPATESGDILKWGLIGGGLLLVIMMVKR